MVDHSPQGFCWSTGRSWSTVKFYQNTFVQFKVDKEDVVAGPGQVK